MPRYRKAIVTYVDILGFRQLIKNSETYSQEVNHIFDVLNTTSLKGSFRHIRAGRQGAARAITKIESFSDLILRATFLKAKDSVLTYIQGELMALGRMQTHLIAKHGILVRGGVSFGDLYMAHEKVFGPALVRSYELAEKTAVFPRIVLDPALAARFVNLRNSGQCMIGDDGTYFIDYLHHQQFILDTSAAFDQLMRQHKQAIEDRLASSKNEERVRQKLMWAALYHNSVVNRTASEKLKPTPLAFLIPERLYLGEGESPNARQREGR